VYILVGNFRGHEVHFGDMSALATVWDGVHIAWSLYGNAFSNSILQAC